MLLVFYYFHILPFSDFSLFFFLYCSGYTSHVHGMTHFDWAVGTYPAAEDVLPFTITGILHDEEETGIPGNSECKPIKPWENKPNSGTPPNSYTFHLGYTEGVSLYITTFIAPS